jgi:peptide/nickel transport system substrate-binding protein
MNIHRRKVTYIILCSTFLGLFTGGCSTQTEEPTSIVYGLTLSPSGIDPHLNASSELGIPLSSVYDTLIFRDPTSGQFVPGLAESWTISSDGLTYTFSLRKDVEFHDGTHFNAQAVQANIDYTVDPDHHSFKAALMLGPLESVERIDDYTVALKLSEPFAPLLDALSQVYLGMASPQALETWGPVDYQFHQVGTGPYRFVEYIPNDHITLTRNPDYAWAPSVYDHTTAGIDTIVFKFFEDPATRALALESGEVDVIGEVPPHDAARLAEQENFELYPIPIPGQPLQFLFNTQRSPTDDLQIRQALIQAVDRQYIVETIFGEHSLVAQGPLAATIFSPAPRHPLPDYDPEVVEALLESAGWEDADGDGLRSRGGLPLELQIVAPSWGSNPEVGQLIQAAWRKFGASVTLEVAPGFGPLKEAQSKGKYNAIGMNLFDTEPDLLRSFYSSTGLYNWSGIEDPELDQLLIQAAQTSLDDSLRFDLYEQITERIQELALQLPIRDYVNLVVATNRLQGLHFSTQGWFPFLIDLRLTQ